MITALALTILVVIFSFATLTQIKDKVAEAWGGSTLIVSLVLLLVLVTLSIDSCPK